MSLFATCIAGAVTASAPSLAAERVVLPSQWAISPAGRLVPLGADMPLRIVVTPAGDVALVLTGGYHDHGIEMVNLVHGRVTQAVALGKAWAGLAATSDGNVYVAGGGPSTQHIEATKAAAALPHELRASLSSPLLRLRWSGERLSPRLGIAIDGLKPSDRFTAGVAVDRLKALFVANIQTDTVYKLDPISKATLGSVRVGYRPFQIALSPDHRTLAVGNWGDRSVSIVDAATLAERSRVSVGVHPTDVVYGADGRLYVANAGSNTVSILQDERVTETVATSLRAGDPVGSTPDALAVSPDGRRLFVANADNNNIAVVDVTTPGHARVVGFIPTGWYPSALAITPDGRTLIVGVAKGIGSVPNVPAHLPDPRTSNDPVHPFDYVGKLMRGYAEIIPFPGPRQLAAYTRQATANVPAADAGISPAERTQGEAAFHQIKHVLYIIRENRTYDQVLGDDPRGEGEAVLAIFGRAVTPNGHRLAELTPLMDRYFMNGEVSEDGHQWANAAYATAFTERATASSYGGRGEPDADDRLTASPAGYLWDEARKAGLSYFSYGEFAQFHSSPSSSPVFEGVGSLVGHASLDWDNKRSDVERAQGFIDDLKRADQTGVWPNYMVMHLWEDHTFGLAPGRPTPKGAVATNDLALGQIVEAVSHSRFWGSTAIFVTEDDAQDGPDHVDDHRSVGLVISPFVRRGFVDHHHYTMMSVVRTMELILGLKPMTQYDTHATALYRLFKPTPTLWSYTALPETEDLNAVNPSTGPLADASSKLDFSEVDRADPQTLNAILWAALRPGVPYPAPVRSAHLDDVH